MWLWLLFIYVVVVDCYLLVFLVKFSFSCFEFDGMFSFVELKLIVELGLSVCFCGVIV